MSFSQKSMPAGFDGTHQSVIEFFNADAPVWEEAAIGRVQDLRSLAKTAP